MHWSMFPFDKNNLFCLAFYEIKAKQSRPTFSGPFRENKLQCYAPDDFFQGVAVHEK